MMLFTSTDLIFFKGKQDALNDVLYLLEYIITYAKFWIGCSIEPPYPHTTIVILLVPFDELYSIKS